MEKLSILISFRQVFLSFNLGDVLSAALNFIQANPFMLLAFVSAVMFLVMCILYSGKVLVYRKTKCLMKQAAERANYTMLDKDRLLAIIERDKYELEERQGVHDATLTTLKETIARNTESYETELEKREHLYQTQMEALRKDIRALKDEHRREAINKAIEWQRVTHIPTLELIETAQKIYKFYCGK